MEGIRKTAHFEAGEVLSSATRDRLFCLREGGVRREIIHGSGFKMVRLLGRGNLFQVDQLSLTKTIFIKEAEACYFHQADILDAVSNDGTLALALWRKVKEDVMNLERRIAGLENHTVRNRVASLLCELLHEFSASSDLGLFIDVNVDRKSLALMAGTVPETLARILTDFEDEGILKRQGRELFFTNVQNLTKIASASKF